LLTTVDHQIMIATVIRWTSASSGGLL